MMASDGSVARLLKRGLSPNQRLGRHQRPQQEVYRDAHVTTRDGIAYEVRVLSTSSSKE